MTKHRKSDFESHKKPVSQTEQQAVQMPALFPRVFLSLIIIAALTAATIARNEVWQSDMTLWEDAVRKSPNKGRAHHNLGRIYDRKGFPNEAFAQYLAAVAADPTLARAHESLGISYVSRNQFDKARQELETALQLNPNLLQARKFLEYIGEQGNKARQSGTDVLPAEKRE
jgi:tetratricopeptide (TPR) repeat protein